MNKHTEKRSVGGTVLMSAVSTYLGIGLILSIWATSAWPKGVVQQPVLVFLQNMLLWPLWLPATIAMGRGSSY